MIPTQTAQLLHPYARRIVDLVEEARGAVEEHRGAVRGDLRIAASTIPGHYILPRVVGAFHKQFDQVRIHLRIADTEGVLDWLRARDVELGFVGARPRRPGLSFRPFARDELVLAVAPGHPLAGRRKLRMDELAALPLLSRGPGSGTRTSWEGLLTEAGVDPGGLRIVAELGSTEALIRGIRSGMGAGIVSSRAVEEELRAGSLVRVELEGPPMERTFYLVEAVGRPLSVPARTFGEFVLSALAEEPA
jgi:DNA-binding transcriptional LysR family regulator